MSEADSGGQPQQLFMRQPDLSELPPAPPLPPGWVLREAVPADYEQMAGILAEGFAESWDAARMAWEFSGPNGVEAKRPSTRRVTISPRCCPRTADRAPT